MKTGDGYFAPLDRVEKLGDFLSFIIRIEQPRVLQMTSTTNLYVTQLINAGKVTPSEALDAGRHSVLTKDGWRLATENFIREQLEIWSGEGIHIPDVHDMAKRLRDIYPDRDIPTPEDLAKVVEERHCDPPYPPARP